MNLQLFTQNLRKPLLLGIFGGAGCLVAAALLGELWLLLSQRPPTTIPQAVVLLIDTSSSMSGNKLREVKTAATGFVNRQDLSIHDMALVEFSGGSNILTDLNIDEAGLIQAIANLSASGGTNLQRGLSTAASLARYSSFTPTILLFTDGAPNNANAALSVAQQVRAAEINLVAVATGDADVNYLRTLTGDPNLVFYANSGQIDQAFQAAEKVIYGDQLIESGNSGDYGLVFGTLRIGVWSGCLALGIGLALIIGQNYTLRRRLLSLKETALGGGGGLLAGLIGGSVGQLVFVPTANIPALSLVARISGWTLLGTLVGGGMSLFVPNLRPQKAFVAGTVGGVLGAIAFVAIDLLMGTVPARLAGALILGFCIGLAIAFSEQLNREATLWVRWTPSEFTAISLGQEPIQIGSSRNAHVYLPKDDGYPEQFAQIFVENGKVFLEFDRSITSHEKFKNMKIFKQELTDGSRRKYGAITLEIEQKETPINP